MATTALKDLLRELENARGLRGRLGILARSFDLLRKLSPADRERVALRVGSDWAWGQIERSFMKDGKLSEAEQVIQQAFETIGSADPSELRQAARRIRERDTDGLEQAAIQTLERILEEDGALTAPPGEAVATPLGVNAALDTVAKSEDVAVTETSEATQPAAAKNASEAPAPAEPKPAAITPRRRLPSPGQPTPRKQPPPPPRRPAPARSRAARRDEPTAPDPPAALAFPSSAERLRALRSLRTPGHAASLGSATRRQWIAGLGSSWAGRRALSSMIQAGALEDLDEALTLIDLLERDSDKVWCLIDWVESQSPAAPERARLLEAAPSPSSRRRLERRLV